MDIKFALSHLVPDDFDQYVQLLKRAYPDQFFFFYPERLNWLPRCSDDSLPVLIAKQDSQIAAWVWLQQSNVFWDKLIIDDAFFSVNTFTLPEFRCHGVGSQLQMQASSEHRLIWSISMSTANRRNRQRLGWHNGVQLDEYCLRIGKFDRKHLLNAFYDYCERKKKPILSKILHIVDKIGGGAILHHIVNVCYPKWKRFVPENELDFLEIAKYGDEWDNLFSRIKANYHFGVNRDSAWMNWSYVDQPHLFFYRYGVYRKNKLIGTVVFRAFEKGELPHGIITDLLVDPIEKESVYQDILQYAIGKLAELNCQYVYLGVSDDKYKGVLLKNGFRCLEHLMSMYSLQNENKEPVLLPTDGWLMSLGDHDIAQYATNRHPSAKQILKMIFQK